MSDVKKIYCHCAYAKIIDEEVKNAVLERISSSDEDIVCLPDICEMAARKDEELKELLINTNEEATSELIQTEIYEIGKKHNFENLRDFFKLIYQVLLGQEQGPRLGSFIKLFGIKKTINLIDEILKK